MGRDRPKKRKKFSFRVPFLLDPSWGIPKKIVKKFQIRKCHFGFISSQAGPGHAKKEIKKILFRVPFLQIQARAFPKT